MTSLSDRPRYDDIGVGYAHLRREDPRFRALIDAALGDARTVVNVGAGAGSYEPADRHVIAIEPSDVMEAQRPQELAPAVRAVSARSMPMTSGCGSSSRGPKPLVPRPRRRPGPDAGPETARRRSAGTAMGRCAA